MSVKERIEKLRELMKKYGLAAYVVPSSDPHMSEYVCERYQSRAWISGFTGSAGTAMVMLEEGGLWTDSRYYLQAADELKGSGLTLFKVGMPDTPDLLDYLYKNLKSGDKVGFDGASFAASDGKKFRAKLAEKNIEIVSDQDLIDQIWEDRPPIPENDIFVHEVKYAGKTRNEKFDEIRAKMKDFEAEYCLVNALDEVCWAFNIRGADVDFNPVAYAYALISDNSARLFVKNEKVPDDVRKELETEGVSIEPYENVAVALANIGSSAIVLDPAKLNYNLLNSIPKDAKVAETVSPVAKLKACKNATEISGMKAALRRDGVAMVKFLRWIEENVGKEKITELSAAAKLLEFRKAGELFFGESFNAITGYKGHGAIVHYHATEESEYELKPEGFYLIDSGGQYFDGTTDITRTIHFGDPTEQEKIDYTLVLQGHIKLALANFPQNTRGSQVDALARIDMWKRGINYLHGTGHGVGCFMNVHEGPQNIRMEENPAVLEPGMILSNEPGIYRADRHGIRIENLVLVRAKEETDFGKFYEFETLTLCPIDTRAIKVDMLDEAERNWLNDYHKAVYDSLAELLDDNDRAWLKEKTAPIFKTFETA